MTLQEFAKNNRMRSSLDECQDPIIKGKFGHIYEHNPVQLGVCVEHPVDSKTGIRAMRIKMRKLRHLGLQERQIGDSEGTFVWPSVLIAEKPLIAQIAKILGIRRIGKSRGKPFRPKDAK